MGFKAFRIHEENGRIVARFDTLDLDALTSGEVVIEVAYSGINYKDALAATGAGKILRKFPLVGGIDLSGPVVKARGTAFKSGDKVIATSYDIGVAHDGGYAKYARIPAA